MIESIGQMLRALRDIEGVLGSFVMTDRGRVIGRDAPASASTEVLELIGGRLQQLCDAFVSANVGGPFESTTLYFAEHKLHIRALGNVFLIAVVTAGVNLPALKMAMNLLGRQLLHELAVRPTSQGGPSLRPSDPPAASSGDRTSEVHEKPPRASEPPTRSYRGRPVSG